MKIFLSGICGHMGKELFALAEAGVRSAQVVAGVDINPESCPVSCFKEFPKEFDGADCVIDFSNHLATKALTEFAVNNRLPLIIATTGQTEEEKKLIYAAAESIPVFFAANFSLGIALLTELAQRAARTLPDAEIEIIEKHHDRKLDAPSGTALAIAEALKKVRSAAFTVLGRSGHGKRDKNEIGIHSIRLGNIVGEHEVILSTGTQTITLKHEAHSRALFAEGALAAAEFLIGKKCGLYGMEDMVV